MTERDAVVGWLVVSPAKELLRLLERGSGSCALEEVPEPVAPGARRRARCSDDERLTLGVHLPSSRSPLTTRALALAATSRAHRELMMSIARAAGFPRIRPRSACGWDGRGALIASAIRTAKGSGGGVYGKISAGHDRSAHADDSGRPAPCSSSRGARTCRVRSGSLRARTTV
jgi:hypothetical protein